MAENQNTITTVFKADISNFSKSTQDLNRYISTVNAEFKNAVAGLDNWSKTQEGLQAKITQLNKILEAEKKKLDNLESAYADMVAAGKENTAEAQKLAIAISNQSAKVKATEKDIGKYTSNLEELQGEAKEAGGEVEELGDKIEDNGKAAEETSGKFGGFIKGLAGVGAAAVGVVGSFVALAESTREYRNEMAKLDTAFKTTGHSAAAAESTYKELYGILGDNGRATEAAQQLAEFSKTEQQLAQDTRILTGVMGKYGDSIPTEGLAEGMAATAAMGEVQGVLADALEWQGVNLEEYNAKLAEMTTEEERAAYIRETLTGLYGEAADAYAENNKEIIEANKAQAELTDATAELGAAAEPLNTILKGLGATLINGLLPYIKDLSSALQTLFSGDLAGGADQLVGVFDNVFSKVGEVATGIVSKVAELLPQILPKLGELAAGILSKSAEIISSIVSVISELLPQVLPQIVELISGIAQNLVGYAPQILEAAKTLLLGVVQAIGPTAVALLAELPKLADSVLNALSEAAPIILSAAQEAFLAIVESLPSVLSALTAALPKILQSIINFLVNSGPKILAQAIELLMNVVRSIPTIVSELSSNLPKIITSITSTLGSNAPQIFRTAVSMLTQVVEAIPQIAGELIRNAPQMITGIVKGLAGGYKALFNVGKDMLKGLWEGMKSLGGWIWDKISGFFNKTIVGGIKKLLGIASPSKVFTQLGKYSAEGYLGGFADTMQHANKTLSRVNYAGAVGVAGGNGAGPSVQNIGGATYNFYQTFSGMEATQYALHKAKVETLNALKLSEA